MSALNEEDVKLIDTYTENVKDDKNDIDSNAGHNTIPFTMLLANKALHIIPHEHIFDVINAIRLKSENHSIKYKGNQHNSFPLEDIFSGQVVEVSNSKVTFPAYTHYGTDRYLVVRVNTGLYIYVPAHQAGLMQPTALNMMQGQNKSVVIEHVLSYGKNEHGNFAPMVAIGSIQTAEYEIGMILKADLNHNEEAFKNFERQGIITDIDNRHNCIQVAMKTNLAKDKSKYQYGYINVTIDMTDIGYAYYWQHKVSDFDFVKLGNTIAFKITQVISTHINDAKRHLKGDYVRLIGSRLSLADVRTPEQFLLGQIIGLNTFNGYLAKIDNTGVYVEIAPKIIVKARIAPRHLAMMRQKFTRDNITEHIPLAVQINNDIHSIDALFRSETPIAIVNTNNSDYHNHAIANDLGVVELFADNEDKKINDKPTSRYESKKQANDFLSFVYNKH